MWATLPQNLFVFLFDTEQKLNYFILMTIKDNGKEFYFERLANGLLRTYDYKSAWDITFKKVDGKWEGHFRGDYPGYAGLLKKLNLLQQQVDAERALAKDLQEVI